MKRSLTYIITAASLVCALPACNVIDEGDRYIEESTPETPAVHTQRVLIEEFTGRKCPNCPNGAQTIAEIQEYYKGRVIAIAIHAGMYAMPIGNAFRDMDLRTEAGNEYNDFFAPQGYPAAMINRSTYDGVIASTIRDKWMTSVIAELAVEPTLELTPTCSYDASTRTVSITTEVEALKSMPNNLNLQVQLTESGIVAAQISNDEIIYDYTHNHVLRTAVNGTWGESLAAMPAGEKKTYSHSLVLPQEWKAENCHIVVFAYETSGSKHVVQCNECAVIENTDELIND